jgi:hypothetical protein
MDPFVIAIGGFLGIMLLWVLFLGVWYPGSGADVLDWHTPEQHAENEGVLESDDLAQMLEGVNAKRRARGERELTLRELREGKPLT